MKQSTCNCQLSVVSEQNQEMVSSAMDGLAAQLMCYCMGSPYISQTPHCHLLLMSEVSKAVEFLVECWKQELVAPLHFVPS